jgi:hypothetical protein
MQPHAVANRCAMLTALSICDILFVTEVVTVVSIFIKEAMNESLALHFLYFPAFLFGPILNERGYNGIRRDYTVLRERRTTQEEWGPLLGKLDDLEREVKGVRSYPSRIDETRIEDRMITIQRRIDEGVMIGRLKRVQGREFQWRLDEIRREFLQRIKDRPFTSEEKGDISSRIDSLERDINRVW